MESKKVKGLYFAGEIIDVDSYTGGFNLQIAYSTGEYFDNGEERMNRSRYFSYSVWNPKGNRYGLMDAEGKRITEALYSDIEALSDDLYLCSIEDGLYRITLNYNR